MVVSGAQLPKARDVRIPSTPASLKEKKKRGAPISHGGPIVHSCFSHWSSSKWTIEKKQCLFAGRNYPNHFCWICTVYAKCLNRLLPMSRDEATIWLHNWNTDTLWNYLMLTLSVCSWCICCCMLISCWIKGSNEHDWNAYIFDSDPDPSFSSQAVATVSAMLEWVLEWWAAPATWGAERAARRECCRWRSTTTNSGRSQVSLAHSGRGPANAGDGLEALWKQTCFLQPCSGVYDQFAELSGGADAIGFGEGKCRCTFSWWCGCSGSFGRFSISWEVSWEVSVVWCTCRAFSARCERFFSHLPCHFFSSPVCTCLSLSLSLSLLLLHHAICAQIFTKIRFRIELTRVELDALTCFGIASAK